MPVSNEYARVLADIDTCLRDNATGLKQCLARVPRRQHQKVAVVLIERYLSGDRNYRLDKILETLDLDEQALVCAFNKALSLRRDTKNETVDIKQTVDSEAMSDSESDVMSGISWGSDASQFSDASTVLSQISWHGSKL